MIGKIYITSSGYDPECGKHVNDPYLGPNPSLGACRPDIRRVVSPGDYIFTISGKVPRVPQFIMGGFQVAEKVPAPIAYHLFPERRLKRRDDGDLEGNIICDSDGNRHPLDSHTGFEHRLDNYVIGENPVALLSPQEIAQGRDQTMAVLRAIFDRVANTPFKVIGRAARTLSEEQVRALLDWFYKIKRGAQSVAVPHSYDAIRGTGH